MKRALSLIVLLFLLCSVSFTCTYTKYRRDDRTWHRRVYSKNPLKFYPNKRKDRYNSTAIEMRINPNENNENVYLLDLNKIRWKECIFNIESSGFYTEEGDYSEKLTEATKFYLVKFNRPDKHLAEVDAVTGKLKYIKKIVNREKLALKIVYDTELIDGEWYKMKSGVYQNNISFYVEEHRSSKKKNRSNYRKSKGE